MTNQFWLPKLAASLLAFAPLSYAQTQKASSSEEPQPTQLSPYVTVATRAPHSQRTLGTVVDVVTPAEAQRRQLSTLGEVLGDVVGAPTVATGAVGGIQSIFLRGTTTTPSSAARQSAVATPSKSRVARKARSTGRMRLAAWSRCVLSAALPLNR